MDTDDVLSPLMDAITGSTKALSFLVDKLDDSIPDQAAFLLRTITRDLQDAIELLRAELVARNCFSVASQNVETHCPGPNWGGEAPSRRGNTGPCATAIAVAASPRVKIDMGGAESFVPRFSIAVIESVPVAVPMPASEPEWGFERMPESVPEEEPAPGSQPEPEDRAIPTAGRPPCQAVLKVVQGFSDGWVSALSSPREATIMALSRSGMR